MKRRFFSRSTVTLVVLIYLVACTLGQTPSEQPLSQPQNTQASVEMPVTGQEETAEPTLNLAGPPPEPGDTIIWVDGSLLAYVPPGEFVMGHSGEDNPEHVVYLDGFWIYRTEVTNSMYLRCMLMGECPPPPVDPPLPDIEDPKIADFPVVGLNWGQAQNYCRFVNGYLPTEAQWEKTARGTDARIYPWGSGAPSCELLNFDDCVGEVSSVIEYPLGASPYDVFDMAGNVFEWVADWYQPNYFSESPFDNPMGPEFGEVRSVRGSTFHTGSDQIASALRYYLAPEEYRVDLGFRCVVVNAQQFAPPCEVLAYAPSDTQGGPSTGPGGSAACVVPQPELRVVTYCQEGVRGNNISWTPADAEIDYSSSEGVSCSQYDADTLACAGSPGGTIEITACKACPPPVVELGVMATCDAPYVLDEPAGLCRYAGAPTPGQNLCAPGFSLMALPDNVCCELQDGTPFDYPSCPPGGRYDAASRICWFTLPSTGDQKCDSEVVYFTTCERPQEDSNGSDDSCPPEYIYCFYTGNQRICVCTQP
jgi:formylglycine-generating enzyme required for sulfatase activity